MSGTLLSDSQLTTFQVAAPSGQGNSRPIQSQGNLEFRHKVAVRENCRENVTNNSISRDKFYIMRKVVFSITTIYLTTFDVAAPCLFECQAALGFLIIIFGVVGVYVLVDLFE